MVKGCGGENEVVGRIWGWWEVRVKDGNDKVSGKG